MSLLPLALAVALAAAPVAGVPTVIAPGCDVTGATLTWGFKESFRAYIDGDIANGEWTTAAGATYDTPFFGWADGTGRYDPATDSGYIQFSGSVRFTGHDGLLDTTIANPTITLDGGSGAMMLDVSGPTMDGDQIDQEGVRFLSLPSVEVIGDDAVRSVDAATELTADGETAFPNYEAGTAFDPVSVTFEVGKQCAVALGGGDVVETRDDSPIVFGLIAFGVLAAAAGAGIFVATRRRRA